jgi:hypothetical protein
MVPVNTSKSKPDGKTGEIENCDAPFVGVTIQVNGDDIASFTVKESDATGYEISICFTVIINVFEVLPPLLDAIIVTVTDDGYITVDGVPVILPVEPLNDSPGGRVDEVFRAYKVTAPPDDDGITGVIITPT